MFFSAFALNAQINVDFSVDENEGCSTLQSKFTDLSTSSEGTIVSWAWEIGDVNSSLESPSRVFTDVGSYEVCLSVTDSKGNEAKECREAYINVYDKPSVDFSWDESVGCAPLTVGFMSSASSPNGEIVEWNWGLGGTTGTINVSDPGTAVTTNYEDDGFHSVTLQVVDDKGCEQSVTKLDIIKVEERPEIIIGTSEPIGCKFPMTVDFENFGSAASIEYKWDFGNGETFVGFDPPPVIYSTAANYSIKVTSRFTSSDCTDELELTDYITEGGAINFDFSPKQGCKGLQVQFEDFSTIQAAKWEWDFGDGSTSQERDPVHLYQEPGTYTISLYRKTAECEGTKIAEQQVVVYDSPQISGSFVNNAGCRLPASVQLNASGTSGNSYSWLVGDPGNYIAQASGANAEILINEFGKYKVVLIAISENGCKNSVDLDSIEIAPLEVEIIGNAEGCVPFLAELELSSNVPSPLNIIESEFSGGLSPVANASFFDIQVEDEGNYNYFGIFENELGCRDTLSIPSLIRGGPAPLVDFQVSATSVCPMELVKFTDLSTGEIDYWSWNIGDSLEHLTQDLLTDYSLPGTYDIELTIGSNGCLVTKTLEDYLTVRPPGVNFELQYNCENSNSVIAYNTSTQADQITWSYSTSSGSVSIENEDTIYVDFPNDEDYLLSLTAFDESSGCTNQITQAVELKTPHADFTVDNLSGCAPLNITLTDNSRDAVEWKYIPSGASFTNPNSPNTSLELRLGGTYENIGLVVTDIHGCTDTTYADPITVNNIKAAFGAPEPVCFDDTLSITSFSTTTFGSITDYTWTLGDNTQVSKQEVPEFTSAGVGKYDIKLVVENNWGCKDSTVLGLGAFFRAPNFDLATDSLACTASEVRFRNELHSAGYNYIWDFGDGTMSSEINPAHLYDEEGVYEVNVALEDNQKCSNDQALTALIYVYDPEASFTVDTTYAACPPLISTFTNNSENAVEYNWNFGDETIPSDSESPSHLYSEAGLFGVELVAIRSENCMDTFHIDDLIELDGPSGTISFEVDSSCVPLMVSLEALLDEEYNMVWDFGDGNVKSVDVSTSSATTSHTYLDAGNYVPKIVMTNSEGCTIVRQGESIEAHELIADFILPVSSFCDEIPDEVTLTSISNSSSTILSYEWIVSGSVNQILQGPNPQLSGSTLGFSDIQLIVESEYCRDSVQIDSILRIGPSPFISGLVDTFTCVGSSVEVDYRGLGTQEVLFWSVGGQEIATNEYVPAKDEFYVLTVMNEYDCESSDSLLVEVIDDNTPFAGEERTICQGDTVIVDISYGDNIKWLTLQECVECNSIAIMPDSNTIYPVSVVNSYGCTVIDTLIVDVLGPDDIDAGDDQRICLNQPTILLGYTTADDYSWSPSTSLSHPTDFLTGARPSETTLYTLSSTKGECTLTDTVLVEIIDRAELQTVGDTICEGEIAELYAGGLVDDVLWMSDPTLSALDIRNPQSVTIESSDFMVVGTLEGCASDTALVHVLVHPSIKASVPDEIRYFSGADAVEVAISGLSTEHGLISWNPEEVVSCFACEEISVSVNGEELLLALTVIDAVTGCELIDSVRIRQIEKCEGAEQTIFVPNIFSPNDDGVNDILEVQAPLFSDIESFAIYDRWGQLVHSGGSLTSYWDGKNNGRRVQQGVYTYSVTAICPEDGSLVVKSGDLTVIR